MSNHYENIPVELQRLSQWVCASAGSKVPMRAYENEAASSTNPETWADYETALKMVNDGYYDYCGFVFADNGYVGIDIDCGYDEEYGLMTPLGADIIGHCRSYTEESRSGRGFHILLRGTLPFKGKNNLKGVEIYKASRYFIMTGNIVLYRDIVENQEAIDYVLEKYFPDVREGKETVVGRDKIYCPRWEDVVTEGRVKLRPVYPRIPDGSRNICLTSLAGMLHNQGYDKAQIYNELFYCNVTACDPPLDKNELVSIVNSITRYKR